MVGLIGRVRQRLRSEGYLRVRGVRVAAGLILFLVCGLLGCAVCPPQAADDDPDGEYERPRWFSAGREPGRGVIIAVHGLNQRPSGIDQMSVAFAARGFQVYRIVLSGHERRSVEVFPAHRWTQEVLDAVRVAHMRYPTQPLFIVGYSLGGLAAVSALLKFPEINPQKVILLAPALSLRTAVLTARWFTHLPAQTARVPNLAPRSYRRFGETPIFWYLNLFQLYDEVQPPLCSPRLKEISALVVLHPYDELVSSSGVVEWLKETGLAGHWRVEQLTPGLGDPSLPAHLIVDGVSLGDGEWERMRSLMLNFLEPTNGS